MEALVSLVVLLAIVGGSDAAWCVCNSDASSSALQKALDYACGAGADCNPIIQNGACYNPNTVLAHCSYAANSYYQRKGQAQGACDFAGSATLTTTDPSGNGCTYPASATGTSTSPPSSTTTPTTPPSLATPTTPPSTTTPNTFTPSPGTGTGTGIGSGTGTGTVLGGLGPSGNTLSTDSSDGGLVPKAGIGPLLLTIFFICILILEG